MSRVVVIGAGLGGLACAARLAARGHQVTVFEQAEGVGGKLGRHERRTPEGVFRFDTGANLLTLPQVFAEFFASTGSTLDEELTLLPLDPVVRHVFTDGAVLDSSSDPAVFAARISSALGPGAAADWTRLWRRAGRVFTASWSHVLQSTIDSPRDLARLVWRLGDLAAIAPGRTLRGIGRSYLDDPRLRMLLDRYATYAGADPRRAPAALIAIPYAELAFGGWYLPGGLHTLADAVLRRAIAHGVRLHTGTRVARIETEGGRACGVQLADGTRVRADVVVANADAAAVYTDLLPTPRRARPLAARSLSGFALLLGVRGRTPGLAHHTVFFPPDYDAELDALWGTASKGSTATPVPDPAIAVTVADDPTVRPDGYEAWFVLVNAPPTGQALDWRRPGLADAYADQVLATLARRGLDVRDRVLFREIRTPADIETNTGTPGGAIYGTAAHRLLRPPNRGPVRDLYLVGGSTHPGGGLPLVTLSARLVADRVPAPAPSEGRARG